MHPVQTLWFPANFAVHALVTFAARLLHRLQPCTGSFQCSMTADVVQCWCRVCFYAMITLTASKWFVMLLYLEFPSWWHVSFVFAVSCTCNII